jgi:hypothetical protein
MVKNVLIGKGGGLLRRSPAWLRLSFELEFILCELRGVRPGA